MSFFSIFTDIFDNLFRGTNPEVKAKQVLRKYENDLRNLQPCIYKNGLLLSSVGEAFVLAYQHTKIIDNIISTTLFSEDQHLNNKYAGLLISTGFTPEQRTLYEGLSYDNCKKDAQAMGYKYHWADEQRQKLENVIKILNGQEFKKIEIILNGLELLKDLCRFNFVSAIHQFDRSFAPDSSNYNKHFEPIPIASLEDVFIDLYYIVANLEITSSTARAIILLDEQRRGKSLDENETDKILTSLKKLSMIFKKILSADNLTKLISLIKHETEPKLTCANYDNKYINNFSEKLQNQFMLDDQRIKTELQDNLISIEVKSLFGNRPLKELYGYNNDLSNLLVRFGSKNLLWITPMQILKTFMTYYFIEPVQNFLNGIIVEGFFNNTTFKSDFSASVFACNEAINRLQNFEEAFAKNGDFDLALIKSYANEGRQNPDLLKKLSQLIDNANIKAYDILDSVVQSFSDLRICIDNILIDSKMAKPEQISNIKVLFMSSRNRDSADILEKDFSFWKNFIDIMRNYVIISKKDK